MISLSCSSCQKNLKVKPDLAGKRIRCPQCKETMEVPTPTVGFEPGRPGFSDEATIPPKAPTPSIDGVTRPSPESHGSLDSHQDATDAIRAEIVYQVEDEIARGGMGAIMRAVDHDIRREVAVKFLLNQADERQKARFVEEAQITGQLEHPNIVPIHQLGVHADGRCFFSMKMVKGRSLAEILKDEQSDYTLGRLLNIFVSICNALSYAHSRHVVHRDLKPANIMVGDFGEVYVMDWGLAKVLGQEPAKEVAKTQIQNKSNGSTHLDVTTNRSQGGELTQAGAIMGTPAYMPPEQARGQDVDARADIYSLGAILYQIMTLTPPVGRDGDMVAILMRVVDGQIDPPAKRSPERAKAGWIPSELSAIAMKALAKEREDRYANVEWMRRDVELFLEGRSVTAKQDTLREQVWKLIKRNKGASIATAAAMVVLGAVLAVAFSINIAARLDAESQKTKAETANAKSEEARERYQKEQDAKETVIKRSIPAMVRAGRQLANEGRIPEAFDQVNLALTYDPNDAEARLLKGLIHLSRQEWKVGQLEIQAYVGMRRDSEAARNLLEKLRDVDVFDTQRIFEVALSLQHQQLTGLSIPLLEVVQKDVVLRKPAADLYAKQLEVAWPGAGKSLSLAKNGLISLKLSQQKNKITDLSPLRGMQLDELDLGNCRYVSDLSSLRGMPLKKLSLIDCTMINDLEPLRGMPLKDLHLRGCDKIKDWTPLQGMPLTSLELTGTGIADLSSLEGMPLKTLLCSSGKFSDLRPLRGMSLSQLDLHQCIAVRDLTPLAGMKLSKLNVSFTRVSDLSPLAGMPLTSLSVQATNATKFDVLAGMSLEYLAIGNMYVPAPIEDIRPLQGMPLRELYLTGRVRDLTPIAGLKLEVLELQYDNVEKIEVLREMKSLTSIRIRTGSKMASFTCDDFWKRYDAGEFKK